MSDETDEASPPPQPQQNPPQAPSDDHVAESLIGKKTTADGSVMAMLEDMIGGDDYVW